MSTTNWYKTKTGLNLYVNHDGPFERIKEVIRRFDPEIVIELGTGLCGFTYIIREAVAEKTIIFTFDKIKPIENIERFNFNNFKKYININSNIVAKACDELKNNNTYFFVLDILKNTDLVKDLIFLKKKVFLWLDNGDKLKEFRNYANFLKSGDMVGVHDWDKEITLIQVEDILVNFIHHHVNYEFEHNYCSRFFIRE